MESTQTQTGRLEDEQKVIVKFLTLTEDIRPKKIHSRLAFVYKENVVPFDNILKWCKHFRDSFVGTKNVKKIRKKKENPFSTLHCAEIPWRRSEVAVNNDEKTTGVVVRKLYGILNKVTEKNFAVLIKQVESLPIDTEDCLRHVIKIILAYVCNEHKYSNLYAKLCAHLYSRSVLYNQQIIGACPMYLGFGEVLRLGCEEDLKMKLLEIESVPFESSDQLRYKLKGLNLFIAELYMLQVLPIEILHDEYLQLLFTDSNNNLYKIENFCISLNKLGKFLEVQCNRTPSKFPKEKLDFYFTHINGLLENKSSLPPRINFMLLDLIELRGRNWIPRLEKKIKFRFIRKFRYKKFSQNANNKNVARGNKNVKKLAKDEDQFDKKETQSGDESKSETGKYPNIIKGDVTDDLKEVQYKVRSAMNKMTDSSFIYLLEQLLALPLEPYSPEIVKLIAEKAIKEPIFCHLYAELCRHLCANKSLNENITQEGKSSFKQLLLNECDKLWNEKINDEQRENYESLFKFTIITKGLAKFIAELYKLAILSNDTINNYIKLLLDESNQTEKNIEFFCYFLTYIGEDLEKENKEMFEQSFITVNLLRGKTPRLPYRIWFMLLDLLELKQRNWLARMPAVVEETRSEQNNRKTNMRGDHRTKEGQNFLRSQKRKGVRSKRNQSDQQPPRPIRSNRVTKQRSKVQQQQHTQPDSKNGDQNINKSCDVGCLEGINNAATSLKLSTCALSENEEKEQGNVASLPGNSKNGEQPAKVESTVSEKLNVESKEKSEPSQ